jgi:hypothetical protein
LFLNLQNRHFLKTSTFRTVILIQLSEDPVTPEKPEHGSARLNIGRMIMLISALVAAWFVLEWLMGGKLNISRRKTLQTLVR